MYVNNLPKVVTRTATLKSAQYHHCLKVNYQQAKNLQAGIRSHSSTVIALAYTGPTERSAWTTKVVGNKNSVDVTLSLTDRDDVLHTTYAIHRVN